MVNERTLRREGRTGLGRREEKKGGGGRGKGMGGGKSVHIKGNKEENL